MKLCVADVAIGVFNVFTYIIVHRLSHFSGVVDLILEYFQYICIDINDSVCLAKIAAT